MLEHYVNTAVLKVEPHVDVWVEDKLPAVVHVVHAAGQASIKYVDLFSVFTLHPCACTTFCSGCFVSCHDHDSGCTRP